MPLYGWEAPDDGQKDCPKHVELLLPINKSWNSVHPLVLFTKNKTVSFCWPSWFKTQQWRQQISARYFMVVHVWRFEYWNKGKHSIWGNGTAPSSQPRFRSITWWRHSLSKITLRSSDSVFCPPAVFRMDSHYLCLKISYFNDINKFISNKYQFRQPAINWHQEHISKTYYCDLTSCAVRLLHCCVLECKTVQFHWLVQY